MATYNELYDIGSTGNSPLRNKIAVACHIAAVGICKELDTVPLHAQRLKWAALVFSSPDSAAEKMMRAVVADNSTLTPAQFSGAADASVQTSVNGLINAFAAVL
jgi:hypothetical protein